MHVIVCLDDKNGMLFNRRRQSSDSVLRKHMLTIIGKRPLWMNPYSVKQFLKTEDNILVEENFLNKAKAGEYCFVEDVEILPYADDVENIIVYRWNRTYPADAFFPDSLLSARNLISTNDFPGNSHDKITVEVYAL